MANALTKNPFYLDTAGVATAVPVRVQKMVWYPVTANDDLSIGHADGSVVWITRAYASASNNEAVGQVSIEFNPPITMSGVNVLTLDSGHVYLYLDSLFAEWSTSGDY